MKIKQEEEMEVRKKKKPNKKVYEIIIEKKHNF